MEDKVLYPLTDCSDPVFNGVRVFWVSRDLSMGTFLFSRVGGYFGSSL